MTFVEPSNSGTGVSPRTLSSSRPSVIAKGGDDVLDHARL